MPIPLAVNFQLSARDAATNNLRCPRLPSFFLKLGLAEELEQNPYTSTHPYTQVFKNICHSNEIYSGEAE